MARTGYRAPANSLGCRCASSPAIVVSAVRCAARDLVNFHLAGEPVVRSAQRHADVEQVGDDREQRCFLAAVLRRRRREDAAYLALEGSLRP
jgi:hypothetical protein